MSTHCYHCDQELTAFGRSDRCPACDADARCCRNCSLEEPGYRYECKETQAEPVKDRERANYCDYFEARQGHAPKRQPKVSADAFQALFRRPPR